MLDSDVRPSQDERGRESRRTGDKRCVWMMRCSQLKRAKSEDRKRPDVSRAGGDNSSLLELRATLEGVAAQIEIHVVKWSVQQCVEPLREKRGEAGWGFEGQQWTALDI